MIVGRDIMKSTGQWKSSMTAWFICMPLSGHAQCRHGSSREIITASLYLRSFTKKCVYMGQHRSVPPPTPTPWLWVCIVAPQYPSPPVVWVVVGGGGGGRSCICMYMNVYVWCECMFLVFVYDYDMICI